MDFPQPQMIDVNGVSLEVFTAGQGTPLGTVSWLAGTRLFLALPNSTPGRRGLSRDRAKPKRLRSLQPTPSGY